jgi:long-chain acyl-CoA synthetase
MTRYRQGRQPLHDYLRSHARATPHKAAIVWYGRRISYAELDALSDRFARCLQDRGIGQGDVIVLFLHNCPQYLIAHHGAQKIGVIVSPCNPHCKAYELGHQVHEVDASAIVAGDELLGVVEESGVLRNVRHVFAANYGAMLPRVIGFDVPPEVRLPGDAAPPRPAFATDFDQALADAGPLAADSAVDIDDVALMAYTSGSTGLPKGAMLSYESALFKTAVAADAFGLGEADVMLADTPLHHISGMVTGITVPVYTGATVVLLHRFDAQAVLQAVECCKVSWWYTMAPSLPAVMDCEDATTYELSSLKTTVATSFGVKLTQALAQSWARLVEGCLVYEAGYGLSETHTCDTIMPRDAVKWGTNGKPAPGVELRIVDAATGRDVPTGTRGEILLRSPVRFKGYWRRPDATAEAVVDGWTRTGDIGVMDDEGYLTFIGRRKEMIKVWSYSVFPEEVEAILATHPDVRQVAVVGCPDPNHGEALQAYVVLHAAAAARANGLKHHEAEQKIIQWCAQHMAHYKVPRTVILRHGLPESGPGKLLRRMLKDPAGAAPSGLRFAYR